MKSEIKIVLARWIDFSFIWRIDWINCGIDSNVTGMKNEWLMNSEFGLSGNCRILEIKTNWNQIRFDWNLLNSAITVDFWFPLSLIPHSLLIDLNLIQDNESISIKPQMNCWKSTSGNGKKKSAIKTRQPRLNIHEW